MAKHYRLNIKTDGCGGRYYIIQKRFFFLWFDIPLTEALTPENAERSFAEYIKYPIYMGG